MRNRAYVSTEAEDAAARIRAALSKGRTTWGELETTKEELQELVRQAYIAEFKNFIIWLRNPPYVSSETEKMAARIRTAVSEGRITWDEIGITEEELGKLVQDAAKLR